MRISRCCTFQIVAGMLSAGGTVSSQEPVPETDFIRYLDGRKSNQPEVLQTSVVRYTHAEKNTSVDLVAIVHIGDPAYYQQINAGLKRFHTVFYELIGGEFPEKAMAKNQATKSDSRKKRFTQSGSEKARTFLGLSRQIDWVDYGAKNFKHADLSWQELYALMEVRNESLTTIFRSASNKGASANSGTGLKSALMGSYTGSDPLPIKRSMAREFGKAEAMIGEVEGDEGTALIAGRNQRVIEMLRQAMPDGNGNATTVRFAILYGAGHMPDFEKRLSELGLEKTSVNWLTAWKISAPKTDPEKSPVNQFLKSLSSGDPSKVDATKYFGDDATPKTPR